MYRLAWFLAGAVFSYIASGYVEGWLEDEESSEDTQKDKPEGRV